MNFKTVGGTLSGADHRTRKILEGMVSAIQSIKFGDKWRLYENVNPANGAVTFHVQRSNGTDWATVTTFDASGNIVTSGSGSVIPMRTAAITAYTAPAASDTAAGNTATQYRDAGGVVWLAGKIKSTAGTIGGGTTLCTLDTAFRPNRSIRVSAQTDDASLASVLILNTGALSCVNSVIAGTRMLILDGISFIQNN